MNSFWDCRLRFRFLFQFWVRRLRFRLLRRLFVAYAPGSCFGDLGFD